MGGGRRNLFGFACAPDPYNTVWAYTQAQRRHYPLESNGISEAPVYHGVLLPPISLH